MPATNGVAANDVQPDPIEPSISAETPDWERERPRGLWDPSRRLLGALRRYQRWRGREDLLGRGVRKLAVLEHRFWTAITASDIPLDCKIGGGLLLTHPNGVVIHPDAEIGPNCLILQQVTITAGVRLDGHVDVGAGAKIVRPVHVGKHANIGANAVVLDDVPAGSTAVGVPARIAGPKRPRELP